MMEFLKKIGIPATVAGIISAFITIIPFIFKLDERYAKEDEVKSQFEAVDKQIASLTVEAGKLAGTQQVLVAVISAKTETPSPTIVKTEPTIVRSEPPTSTMPPPPLEISTAPPKNASERVERLEQVTQQLQTTQRNLSVVGEIKPEKTLGESRAFKK